MSKDITKLSTEEQAELALANPQLLDRLGSSDLKRLGKLLVRLLHNVGAASEQRKSQCEDLELNCEILRIRVLELTGTRPPDWSYVHKEEALRLHAFTGFFSVDDENSCVVCGEEAGVGHPIYEYDYDDLGRAQAAEAARLMLVHLRQTFLPRKKDPSNEH